MNANIKHFVGPCLGQTCLLIISAADMKNKSAAFKSTVKPIQKDRFFSCNCSFSIPGASSDTSKHDEVYDSAIC